MLWCYKKRLARAVYYLLTLLTKKRMSYKVCLLADLISQLSVTYWKQRLITPCVIKKSTSWFLMFCLHNALELSEIIQIYSNCHCWSLRFSTMQILLRKLNRAYLELSTCLLLCSVKHPDGLLLETYLWKIFFRKQLIWIYFIPIDIWKNVRFNVLSGLRARYNADA